MVKAVKEGTIVNDPIVGTVVPGVVIDGKAVKQPPAGISDPGNQVTDLAFVVHLPEAYADAFETYTWKKVQRDTKGKWGNDMKAPLRKLRRCVVRGDSKLWHVSSEEHQWNYFATGRLQDWGTEKMLIEFTACFLRVIELENFKEVKWRTSDILFKLMWCTRRGQLLLPMSQLEAELRKVEKELEMKIDSHVHILLPEALQEDPEKIFQCFGGQEKLIDFLNERFAPFSFTLKWTPWQLCVAGPVEEWEESAALQHVRDLLSAMIREKFEDEVVDVMEAKQMLLEASEASASEAIASPEASGKEPESEPIIAEDQEETPFPLQPFTATVGKEVAPAAVSARAATPQEETPFPLQPFTATVATPQDVEEGQSTKKGKDDRLPSTQSHKKKPVILKAVKDAEPPEDLAMNKSNEKKPKAILKAAEAPQRSQTQNLTSNQVETQRRLAEPDKDEQKDYYRMFAKGFADNKDLQSEQDSTELAEEEEEEEQTEDEEAQQQEEEEEEDEGERTAEEEAPSEVNDPSEAPSEVNDPSEAEAPSREVNNPSEAPSREVQDPSEDSVDEKRQAKKAKKQKKRDKERSEEPHRSKRSLRRSKAQRSYSRHRRRRQRQERSAPRHRHEKRREKRRRRRGKRNDEEQAFRKRREEEQQELKVRKRQRFLEEALEEERDDWRKKQRHLEELQEKEADRREKELQEAKEKEARRMEELEARRRVEEVRRYKERRAKREYPEDADEDEAQSRRRQVKAVPRQAWTRSFEAAEREAIKFQLVSAEEAKQRQELKAKEEEKQKKFEEARRLNIEKEERQRKAVEEARRLERAEQERQRRESEEKMEKQKKIEEAKRLQRAEEERQRRESEEKMEQQRTMEEARFRLQAEESRKKIMEAEARIREASGQDKSAKTVEVNKPMRTSAYPQGIRLRVFVEGGARELCERRIVTKPLTFGTDSRCDVVEPVTAPGVQPEHVKLMFHALKGWSLQPISGRSWSSAVAVYPKLLETLQKDCQSLPKGPRKEVDQQLREIQNEEKKKSFLLQGGDGRQRLTPSRCVFTLGTAEADRIYFLDLIFGDQLLGEDKNLPEVEPVEEPTMPAVTTASVEEPMEPQKAEGEPKAHEMPIEVPTTMPSDAVDEVPEQPTQSEETSTAVAAEEPPEVKEPEPPEVQAPETEATADAEMAVALPPEAEEAKPNEVEEAPDWASDHMSEVAQDDALDGHISEVTQEDSPKGEQDSPREAERVQRAELLSLTGTVHQEASQPPAPPRVAPKAQPKAFPKSVTDVRHQYDRAVPTWVQELENSAFRSYVTSRPMGHMKQEGSWRWRARRMDQGGNPAPRPEGSPETESLKDIARARPTRLILKRLRELADASRNAWQKNEKKKGTKRKREPLPKEVPAHIYAYLKNAYDAYSCFHRWLSDVMRMTLVLEIWYTVRYIEDQFADPLFWRKAANEMGVPIPVHHVMLRSLPERPKAAPLVRKSPPKGPRKAKRQRRQVRFVTVPVDEVEFSQDSIASRFKCGIGLYETVGDLRCGKVDPMNISKHPWMELLALKIDDRYISRCNRRLWCMRELQRLKRISDPDHVEYVKLKADEPMNEVLKDEIKKRLPEKFTEKRRHTKDTELGGLLKEGVVEEEDRLAALMSRDHDDA